jgi:hypothetical protein
LSFVAARNSRLRTFRARKRDNVCVKLIAQPRLGIRRLRLVGPRTQTEAIERDRRGSAT